MVGVNKLRFINIRGIGLDYQIEIIKKGKYELGSNEKDLVIFMKITQSNRKISTT